MIDMPQPLLATLSPADVPSAEAWWSALSDTARSEILILWDERQDRCLFGLEPGPDGPRRRPSSAVGSSLAMTTRRAGTSGGPSISSTC